MPDSPFSLAGKNVCIVGAGGLIGQPTVEAALAIGATVLGGGRTDIAHAHASFHFHTIDISDEVHVRAFADWAMNTVGRIDGWINCAWPRMKYDDVGIDKISSSHMLEDINHHLMGYYNCCRYALKCMTPHSGGSIVNCGSIYGAMAPDSRIYEGTEINSVPTYAMIKSGIHGMSRYLAGVAAADNVRVNCVAPGGIVDDQSERFQKQYADRVPLKRMANPDDISGPLLFLTSDAARYITGQVLFVDGGLSAW